VTSRTDPRDISNLMSRAGFTLLTVDVDEVSIGYPSMWELLDDLRDGAKCIIDSPAHSSQ
jgi:hypothetical protein